MAFVLEDRVRETSTTAGTGALTLAGTLEGFQTFDAVLGTGDTTWYCAVFGAEWEVGLGTFTAPDQLDRTTVLSSSNGGSAVDFSAGTKDVFITVPGSAMEVLQSLGSLGTAASKNVGTASGNVPELDGSGKLATSVLPALALTSVNVVGSEAAMLALTAEQGDIAIRTDINKSFALATNSPSTLADWKELLTPTDLVLSVAGLTGAISASGLRTALSLTVGTDVQAYDAGNAPVKGKQSIWIPAGAMTARTTNGAASGTVELTTNKQMFKTLDFDTSTQEFAQFWLAMPKQWNEGTVTFRPVHSHAATTTNFGVVYQLQGVAISDDDAADASFGTAQTSTDTGGTTNDIYVGPESSAITIAGSPAAEDVVCFQVARAPANGSDTLAIDSRLHGIILYITTDAGNDA